MGGNPNQPFSLASMIITSFGCRPGVMMPCHTSQAGHNASRCSWIVSMEQIAPFASCTFFLGRGYTITRVKHLELGARHLLWCCDDDLIKIFPASAKRVAFFSLTPSITVRGSLEKIFGSIGDTLLLVVARQLFRLRDHAIDQIFGFLKIKQLNPFPFGPLPRSTMLTPKQKRHSL